MTDAEIQVVIDGILEREGRVYTPGDIAAGDPPTKYGITSATLGRWRQLGRDATSADVEAMSESEARAIYTAQYITGPRFDAIPDERLRSAVIDFGVNSGVERAAWYLQRAAGVRPDMTVGPATIAAVASQDPVILLCRVTRGRISVLTRWIRACPAARGRYVAVIDRAVSFLPA